MGSGSSFAENSGRCARVTVQFDPAGVQSQERISSIAYLSPMHLHGQVLERKGSYTYLQDATFIQSSYHVVIPSNLLNIKSQVFGFVAYRMLNLFLLLKSPPRSRKKRSRKKDVLNIDSPQQLSQNKGRH
jgi:hypothetical protein